MYLKNIYFTVASYFSYTLSYLFFIINLHMQYNVFMDCMIFILTPNFPCQTFWCSVVPSRGENNCQYIIGYCILKACLKILYVAFFVCCCFCFIML